MDADVVVGDFEGRDLLADGGNVRVLVNGEAELAGKRLVFGDAVFAFEEGFHAGDFRLAGVDIAGDVVEFGVVEDGVAEHVVFDLTAGDGGVPLLVPATMSSMAAPAGFVPRHCWTVASVVSWQMV